MPDELSLQLERADTLSGRDQTDLNAEANDDDLGALLQGQQILELKLSKRDMDALLDAIANPPPPNDAMLRSVARWRAHMKP